MQHFVEGFDFKEITFCSHLADSAFFIPSNLIGIN